MCLCECKRHIAIVSADEDFLSDFSACLTEGGYFVEKTCKDGIDAVMYLPKSSVDAVFVDDNISLMDSKSIIEKIVQKGYGGMIFHVTDKICNDEKFAELTNGNIIKPVSSKFIIPWLFAEFKKHDEYKAILKGKNELLDKMDKDKMWQEAVGMIASNEKICVGEAEIILLEKIKSSGMEREEFIRKIISV